MTPRYKPVWLKKNVSLYDSPSLNVSSILGDVFVHICTVSRVESKRFHRKVNSRCFCWFPAAPWRFNTKLYKVACHASANNSETMHHKDVRPGEVVYVLVFYNIFLFLAYFIERLRIYFFMTSLWKPSIDLVNDYTQLTQLACFVFRETENVVNLFSLRSLFSLRGDNKKNCGRLKCWGNAATNRLACVASVSVGFERSKADFRILFAPPTFGNWLSSAETPR